MSELVIESNDSNNLRVNGMMDRIKGKYDVINRDYDDKFHRSRRTKLWLRELYDDYNEHLK